MGKWKMVRLGEVFDLQMGKTPSRDKAAYWNDGIYKWISIADIGQANKYITDTKETITQNAIQETGIKLVPKNTVIMSFKLSLGKTAITSQDMYTNEAIMAFHNKGMYSADIDYLYHLFRWFPWGLNTNKAVMGATLNKATLSNIKIPLPPLDEQKRIAKNLDLASEIVKGCKGQLAELDKLVQSVFYEIFGDPVTNEKGWEVTCLSEVCKKITDGTHNSPENLETGEYRYITAKNIKREGILLSNITYVTKQVHEEIYARCNPEMGDVLYIKDGVTTGIAVVNTLNEPFSMLSSVALLKLKNTICNKYLCNVLNCKEMYQKIRENMGGAAITRLTLVKIKNIQIPLPPLPLQTRFATIVTEVEAQKAQIQQALTEAENLFNSLMQEYFE